MALLSSIFISVFVVASGEAERTVRAEPIIPVPGIGARNTGMYQIQIGHKGVVQGSLPDAASYDHEDEVIELKKTVPEGLQVLRIQHDEPTKEGGGCAAVGLCLVLASLVGIAMKLHEADDPYADLRGGSKPLRWVRMSIQSSTEALDDDFPAIIKKQAQELVSCINYMLSKALRKTHAKIRRMARPNMAKYDFDDSHVLGVQFVPSTVSEPDDLLGDAQPLLLPEEPKPSELANLTMEALAKQLEEAGQDELAAQMLSSSSKAMAMGQMRSNNTEVNEDLQFESETEYDL